MEEFSDFSKLSLFPLENEDWEGSSFREEDSHLTATIQPYEFEPLVSDGDINPFDLDSPSDQDDERHHLVSKKWNVTECSL